MSFWHGKGRNLPTVGQKVSYDSRRKIMVDEGRRSRRIGDGLVDQQYRDIVAHRVDSVAFRAFQAFAVFLAQINRRGCLGHKIVSEITILFKACSGIVIWAPKKPAFVCFILVFWQRNTRVCDS